MIDTLSYTLDKKSDLQFSFDVKRNLDALMTSQTNQKTF